MHYIFHNLILDPKRSKLKNLKIKDQEERETHIQGLKLIKIKDKFKEIGSLIGDEIQDIQD
jgi:predicted nucleic acid-binding Zn finger protein